MKIKTLLMTLTATAGLSVAAISAKPNTVNAATENKTVNYVPGYGIAVWTSPNADHQLTGKYLQHGTSWKVFSYTTVDNTLWANVGGDQWVQAQYLADAASNSTQPEIKYVNYKPGYGIAVLNSPYNGALTGTTLKHGTSWKVFGYVNAGGKQWANVGGNQWVQAQYLSDSAPVAQAPTLTMTATAYDPRVLGNYTFGYDTVAANLSVFPRGTKLAITFANGTTKNYVVRDTGGFAYANPNQLDIAMPNAQALQFGRQNIKVRVIH
ncbi:3D domain-containing protein [Lacticaseibacillus brantae]|uniref:Surface layer protein A domain-containing protein n=1 Tax=Lacticaseibacillus brantae DSM 23927 TaxID=1423727 RepID=A0A0R2B069_9LACO|nr:3D domain-containing protein [Lacticaseibacillus brantae]KRM72437.1 hypothetical protein FC34_GL000142 [Lacticaseibacillus brantae DSM 23927]